MKKIVLAICGLALLGSVQVQAQIKKAAAVSPKQDMRKTIYDFKAETLSGDTLDFSRLKGQKILVVNTASNCGYTPQYKELEELHRKYEGRLAIVAFPTNDFGGQEPGSNKEIASFCEKNYGVTFPVMAKITVKGAEMHPIYQFLTQKEKNGTLNSEVEWNFQKYLLDENGRLVRMLSSKVKPLDSDIIGWLEGK